LNDGPNVSAHSVSCGLLFWSGRHVFGKCFDFSVEDLSCGPPYRRLIMDGGPRWALSRIHFTDLRPYRNSLVIECCCWTLRIILILSRFWRLPGPGLSNVLAQLHHLNFPQRFSEERKTRACIPGSSGVNWLFRWLLFRRVVASGTRFSSRLPVHGHLPILLFAPGEPLIRRPLCKRFVRHQLLVKSQLPGSAVAWSWSIRSGSIQVSPASIFRVCTVGSTQYRTL